MWVPRVHRRCAVVHINTRALRTQVGVGITCGMEKKRERERERINASRSLVFTEPEEPTYKVFASQ